MTERGYSTPSRKLIKQINEEFRLKQGGSLPPFPALVSFVASCSSCVCAQRRISTCAVTGEVASRAALAFLRSLILVFCVGWNCHSQAVLSCCCWYLCTKKWGNTFLNSKTTMQILVKQPISFQTSNNSVSRL